METKGMWKREEIINKPALNLECIGGGKNAEFLEAIPIQGLSNKNKS
jgi:hypothetical protein